MELCSDGHEEICFVVACPLCEAIQEKAEIEQELEGWKEKVASLEHKMSELEQTVRDYSVMAGE